MKFRTKTSSGWRHCYNCLLAAICLVCIIAYHHPIYAEDTVPVPATKPASIADAGLLDFTKTFFNLTKPQSSSGIPMPPSKPQVAVENVDNNAPSDNSEAASKRLAVKTDYSKPLSQSNIGLYKTIFALQDAGKISAADKAIAKLTDDRLYGYVLQQRYLHPKAYTSSFAELQDWLDQYADHPGAKRIYELAERKRPEGNHARLKEPETKILIIRRGEPTMIAGKRYVSAQSRSDAEAEKIKNMRKKINESINGGNPQAALGILQESQNKTSLDTVEYDILNARIAAAFLYKGDSSKALSLASKSAERSGLHVPVASWVAGLVTWKTEDYTKSAHYFENVGRSNYASSWTRSAGAYWAARAHMRRGDVKAVSTWLRRASSAPRTFYGLIATRALGENFDFNWQMPTFTQDNLDILSSDPRGVRAIALAAIGELPKAQAELLRFDTNGADKMENALLAFAGYAKLPGLAMRLGAATSASGEERYHDAALYPVSPWQPQSGFKIKSALLHAMMRQESRFNPDAKSPSGATGLMQLMPATAKAMGDEDDLHMDNPRINLELGQNYLLKLLKLSNVDQNLLSLLIAYNAGPGNLSKWKRQWSDVSDPLLFIELLPSAETRGYIERVLSNYWIYRLRNNEDTPTLDAVVAGTPVKYALVDGTGIQTASARQ